VAFDVHEVANSDHNFLDLLGEFAGWGKDESLAGLEVGIDLLQSTNREGGGFSSAGLGLRNDIGA
jgi:hypothetical protein